MRLLVSFIGGILSCFSFYIAKNQIKKIQGKEYTKKEKLGLLVLQIVCIFYLCRTINDIIYICFLMLFMPLFFIMSLTDIKEKVVSTKSLIYLFILTFIYVLLFKYKEILNHILGMIAAILPIGLLKYFYKNSVGSGDIYILGILGLLLKEEACFILMSISYFLAGLYSIYAYIVLRKSRKSEIAMFPFFYIGFCVYNILKFI